MAEIFISYARVDRERAQALAGALGREGWSVWWDRDIPPGRTFDDVIEEALAAAKCVIVLWSRESIRSEWVKAEASEAARRHILVPVLADQVMPPLEFRRIQSASLPEWATVATNPDWSQLCQAVGGLVRQPTPQLTLPASTTAAAQSSAPRPGWRAASVLLAASLVMVVLGWFVASYRPGPATATPLEVAPVVKVPPPAPPDTGVAVAHAPPPGQGVAVASAPAVSTRAPRPLESSRMGRPQLSAHATSNASPTAAPIDAAHEAVLSSASPATIPAPAPIVQPPPRASGTASFDVVYTRGVFRESGRLSVSPDGVRYAESGGRSAFDAACGDLRRVQVMTVIVDGEQRMVELHTKDRVHRFTTGDTAARNGLVSALSRTCGAR